jgi:hypothetical protein
MEIAKTILQQLGGQGRLIMFTGANNFVALKNGVTFKIKNRKVNFIKITLNSLDLYDVYFYKLAAGNLKLISEHNDIYFDELIPLFEKQTGMYLSLYMKGGKIKKDESRDMIFSQLKQIHHHEKELKQIIAKDDNIEPWVIAKMQRATTDLADITHYEDGKTDKMEKGGEIQVGNKFGDWSITQYKPIVYEDTGGTRDGLIKLVNQDTFDEILVQYDGGLRNPKWIARSKGVMVEGKSPKQVIEKLKIADGGGVSKFADGGGIIPASGILTTKDKKNKLDYKKIGDNYEFVIYDGEPNPVENYSRVQYKKRDKNKVLMNYNQFVNYLYSEGYIDDKMKSGGKFEDGGVLGFNYDIVIDNKPLIQIFKDDYLERYNVFYYLKKDKISTELQRILKGKKSLSEQEANTIYGELLKSNEIGKTFTVEVSKLEKGGKIDEDLVIFSVDDEKLDTLLHNNYHKNLDYITIKNDEYYTLNKRDFDRFIDSGDSNGFDVDYENSEDAVVYVIENVDKKEQGGSIDKTDLEYSLRLAIEKLGVNPIAIKSVKKSGNKYTIVVSSYIGTGDLIIQLNKILNSSFEIIDGSLSKTISGNKIFKIQEVKKEKSGEIEQIKKGDFVKLKSDGRTGKIKSYKKNIEHYIVDFRDGIEEGYPEKDLIKISKMENGGAVTGANEQGFKKEQVKDFDDVKKGDICVNYNGNLYEVITTGYGSEIGKKADLKYELWIAEERTKLEDFDETPLISVKGENKYANDKVEFGVYSYDSLGAVVYVDNSKEVKDIIDVIDKADIWGELYLISPELEQFSDNEAPLNKKQCIATIIYVEMNNNASDIKSSLEEQGIEFEEETPDFDFEDVYFKTEGDYDEDYFEFQKKLKIIRKYIDFDYVSGSSDSYETYLNFGKDGINIANINGEYDSKNSKYTSYLRIGGNEAIIINFHPYDSMGGFDSDEFEKQVKQAVESKSTTSTIPGLDSSKQLSISEIGFLYDTEPKLNDPYYPKELIKTINDIAYYKVMINGNEYLLAMNTEGIWDDKWYLVSKSSLNQAAIKEPGSAEIKIGLENGNVTVTHATSGEVLLNLQNVPKGSWDKLWDFLKNDLV